MGKSNNSLKKVHHAPKKSKKQSQNIQMRQSDSEQIEDVMAWGRKKQNYYKEDQQQYSSLEQQEQQAKKIYQNQYNNYMNDEDLYDLPAQKVGQASKKGKDAQYDELEQDEQQKLPSQYINKQLAWVLELFNDLEFYENNDLLSIYEQLLKSYLTALISIKQFDIPYIQYHPIINLAVDIKTKISKLMKKLSVKDQQQNASDQEQNDQIQEISNEMENMDDLQGSQQEISESLGDYPDHCTNSTKVQQTQHQKGLAYYNKIRQQQVQQKKSRKKQRRNSRVQVPAFRSVGQNQGRFASQMILKNKGLMKKRKKIEGNSRVKLRHKFEKKQAIHRARTGHFINQNPGRKYQGQGNIRMGKIKGVRLH